MSVDFSAAFGVGGHRERERMTVQLYCIGPLGFLPWEIRGAFPGEKPPATESRFPTYGAHWVFLLLPFNPPNSDMDHKIFSARTDVSACDCTRKRVCTESCLREKNPSPHRGIETASAACRSDALPTELHPQPGSWPLLQHVDQLLLFRSRVGLVAGYHRCRNACLMSMFIIYVVNCRCFRRLGLVPK